MNRIFTFENGADLTFDPVVSPQIERAVRLCGAGLTLRKLNAAETAYDPTGLYKEGVVTLPNHRAVAMTELTGFHADELTSGSFGGSLGYQLSTNNGATWRTWDTMTLTWAPAVGPLAGVYASKDVVEEHIGALGLTPQREFRIRVKLTPTADGKKRPMLTAIVVDLEYDYEFETDVVRSLKHHLEGLVRTRLLWVDQVTAATTVVVDLGMTVRGPVRVYNLTTDPNRTANLFTAIMPDGKTVTMAPAQTGKIEVNYFGEPKVFISAEENYQLGAIPAVLINMPTVVDRPEHGASAAPIEEYDVNRRTFASRRRFRRSIFDATITLSCQAQLKHIALAMADAVEKALQPYRTILSEAVGEAFAVLSVGPKTQLDQVSRSLFVTNVALTLGGHAWLRPEYEAVPVTREVVVAVRPADPIQVGGAAGTGFTETIQL